MATQAECHESTPLLSVLVIGYRMPTQLANTLYSLSCKYQLDVSENDYEVVVVENESDENLPDHVLGGLPSNFNFFRRPNESVSPVSAIEFALEKCRGKYLGILIDGAQMLTPRVLKYVFMAGKITAQPLVAVPGYHLGTSMQHKVADSGELIRQQTEFLDNSNWEENGYRLFDWSCFSPGNRHGYLHPLMESNAFFCLKQSFLEIGGADKRFQFPGGGAINLHLYRSLGLLKNTRVFLLPGEGTFHQYHGGVTTDNRKDYEEKVAEFSAQLQEIWSSEFHALRREPFLLGTMNEHSLPFLVTSSNQAEIRHKRLRGAGRALWEDDVAVGLQ